MSNITVSFYDLKTGLFTGRTMSCSEELLEMNIPEGCGFVEGMYSRKNKRVNLETGEVEDYIPEPPPNTDLVTYVWDGTDWKGHPTLLARKIEAKNIIKLSMQHALNAPIMHLGHPFDADDRSVMALTERITAIQGGGSSLPAGFTWRDANNRDHPADVGFLVGLLAAITHRRNSLHEKAKAKKAEVDACQTPDQLEEILPLLTTF